ncbi:MAG: AAA family ATPase [Magnetococcales bacterium]|nr:AAA family ATPase [Magnetococcales bacterium]
MTDTSGNSIENVLSRLRALTPISFPNAASIESSRREWVQAIEKYMNFIDNKSHRIVFIGVPGVGKSSLVGVASNLFIGTMPRSRNELKTNSILAIGAGRTTVCEVHVRAVGERDRGEIGLIIDPTSDEEMEKAIQDFAEDEWQRRKEIGGNLGEDDQDPTPQEVQRVLRNMTGYPEYSETYIEDGLKKKRTVRPLDRIVHGFSTKEELSRHLIERVNLETRRQVEWWWQDSDIESQKELKKCFEAVNLGKEKTTVLPKRLTVVVKDPFPGSESGLELTLIDSRGLDGPIETRGDLQAFLRDERAVIVLCTPFKDAPGEAIRSVLRSMITDAELRMAIARVMLVPLDQGDSDQVNGADGDREFGQDLKKEECRVALEGIGLQKEMEKTTIISFDVLNDDRVFLLKAIDSLLLLIRKEATNQLIEVSREAERFLQNVEAEFAMPRRDEVDDALRLIISANLPVGVPVQYPLKGMEYAIRNARSTSRVHATCRRKGTYAYLDLYSAVETEARRAATLWLDELVGKLLLKLDRLENEENYKIVVDHIRLRKRQYRESYRNFVRVYAEGVHGEVRELLVNDSVWLSCEGEWGRGRGYLERVWAHISGWANLQLLTAHERLDATDEIPFMLEMSRRHQAMRFTLYIRNLRVLHNIEWEPTPVSLIIGANGVGKTTLLMALRLLRMAYERDLPEALAIVLGGSSNLRTWGASSEDPIEVGLDIGETSWRIQLVQREGTVDYLTKEILSFQGREVFSSDNLGAFFYRGERLEATTKLGLRTLIDRGFKDSSIHLMAAFLRRIFIYHDPDLYSLRQGSNTSENRRLDPRGTNSLAVMRRWYQERSNQHRYQFVIEGLRAAFPNLVYEMDFEEAGTTLAGRIYSPGRELPMPLATEANGVLQLLVLLCDLASAEDESIVAIDEPENGLHPWAVRSFLRQARRWGDHHNLTILLATHSMVLLDELNASPEEVFVMKQSGPNRPMPKSLNELFNREWLSDFNLGSLYEQGELGCNVDGL